VISASFRLALSGVDLAARFGKKVPKVFASSPDCEGKKPVISYCTDKSRKCAEIKIALFSALEKAGMISRC